MCGSDDWQCNVFVISSLMIVKQRPIDIEIELQCGKESTIPSLWFVTN